MGHGAVATNFGQWMPAGVEPCLYAYPVVKRQVAARRPGSSHTPIHISSMRGDGFGCEPLDACAQSKDSVASHGYFSINRAGGCDPFNALVRAGRIALLARSPVWFGLFHTARRIHLELP
ncbi:hypothetical protein CHELA1G11_13462 [Hyphomicrobiales bacterium]|nr:hypothetical protein CHELA1G2_10857 [Hyphomicrobiales bacterium]CAH1671838.1 hypothetical protein CHELA1G11_13462 [Hyphomicrobiales bacterium]